MPNVRNNSKGTRGFCVLKDLKDGEIPSPMNIERMTLLPGQTANVPQRFLDSEGAKAMFKSKDVSLVTGSDSEEAPAPAEVSTDESDEGGKKKGKGGAK